MTDDMGFSNEPKLPGEKRSRKSRKDRGASGAERPPIIPSASAPPPPPTPAPAAPNANADGPPLADAPPPSSAQRYPSQPTTPWDGLRHFGLFLGILSLPIFAVIYGIQTLRAARKGASVNVAGAVVALSAVGLLALGAVSAAVYVALQPGETRDVTELAVGDCLMPNGLTEDAPDELSTLRVIDCEEPHFGQVFFTGSLPSGPYPERSDMIDQLDQICGAQAGRVSLGPDDPDGYMQYLAPTQEGWFRGDREYTCLVVASGEDRFVGSAVSP